MKLADYEKKWSEFLASEQCPPVLGLAPLSDDEAAQISALVRDHLDIQPERAFKRLLALLNAFPAVMSVWLAHKAGIAYDENFWPNFEHEVGAPIPILRRPDLVAAFSTHTRTIGADYTSPPDLGPFWLVDTMLFYAGLPLCHCRSFANACLWAEKNGGLPDPDAPEAGEQLRDAVLHYPQIQGIPTLLKSLRGPAGPLVCAEALGIIFQRDAIRTSPRFSEALRDAFANIGTGGPRRSARHPFLRLASDFCSLEILGPRQDPGLLAGTGVMWMVNGALHRCGSDEEFIFRVAGEARVDIELRGLLPGISSRRVFDFDWMASSFLVFEGESRRQKRADGDGTITLQSGNYWLLHPTTSVLEGGDLRHDWPDGVNAISQMVLRPGRNLALDGANPVQFRAAQSPFLDATGRVVQTDDGNRLHYGWEQLPNVWCPANTNDSAQWQLHVYLDNADAPDVFSLNAGEEQGSFVKFLPSSKEWIAALRPGLHRLRCVITRGRRRAELEKNFWYWAGLTEWEEGRRFVCGATPSNLYPPECRGFDLEGNLLRYRPDGRRQHSLVFEIDSQLHAFAWSRAGVFVESFERRAGSTACAQEHPIPHSFPADIDSTRWLRIWQVPARQAELRVNDQKVQSFLPGQPSCELSLAHLASLFPQGGLLTLLAAGLNIRIASFQKPLTPTFINLDVTEGYESLVLKFQNEIRWVRPRLRELVSGRAIQFEGARFSSSGHCLFTESGLPTVECANVCDNLETPSQFCRISLDVTKNGWPTGIWFAELDVRRSDDQEWEAVLDAGGGNATLVWFQPPTCSLTDPRAHALWWAAGQSLAGEFVPRTLCSFMNAQRVLADLMAECEKLLSRGYAEAVWARVNWVRTLSIELARQAAFLLREDDGALRSHLLSVVGCEPEVSPRSLIATVPALLASPAASLAKLAGEDPLRTALRRCAEISSEKLVSLSLRNRLMECLSRGQVTGLVVVLGHFANYQAVLQPEAEALPSEFSRFDLIRYWGKTIGVIDSAPDELEFTECELLGRRHALVAIGNLLRNRANDETASALTVFASADELCRWLREALGDRQSFMSDAAWNHPWLNVDLPGDAFTGQCACFCSLFALASRAAATGWIEFGDFIRWLRERHGGFATGKAVTTLIWRTPELLGYYLVFWELIIRTAPHD